MWLMLQQGQPDDYDVATEVGATVPDFCEASFSPLGMNYQNFIVVEDRFKRPADVDAFIGDASKAKAKFGWSAKSHWRELA